MVNVLLITHSQADVKASISNSDDTKGARKSATTPSTASQGSSLFNCMSFRFDFLIYCH